ncbi:MAG: adenosylcobinamide-GDP ribazoletransferase [Planctomycetes bacterium]|nr:adenosylcobinamide-GDP ribazoletransferase [Planctomycetota bacterium]
MREELAIFSTALRFFTRLPVPGGIEHTARRFAAAVRYYPVVGLILGAILAAAWVGLAHLFPQPVAAVLIVALAALLTGALHEDGFADLCDGLGAGGDKARTLAVMRDSRTGAFGALGLVLLVGLKLAALASMAPERVPMALLVVHGLSRLAPLLAVVASRPADDGGLGKSIEGEDRRVRITFIAVYVVFFSGLVWTMDGASGVLAVAVTFGLLHLATRFLYERRLGGYTGDCLGALQQVGEVSVLLGVLAWP